MQSPQTPGVYYERVDASAPAIALLRTDIAGFVGIATRGPLHQPLPVQSWRQFQAYFGDFTGAGYLAYAARAFFENGGQRCWIVRVASETAASAALTLQSESFTDVWTISASSPGVWGNDLDIVIRKAIIFTLVTVTLIAVYLGVLALATLGNAPRLLVGLALLIVTFRPVHQAARAIADRLVYGKRASAYEVMTEFTGHVGETYATEDVLPRMARILAEGTGAAVARVFLRLGSDQRPVATWPPDAVPTDDEIRVPVLDQGEELGALGVTMPPNDPWDASRERLVSDLASQAGLVLRNVRLIEELKASRQRLVAAQDEERRRLERNIHDGAQQQLVALNVQLGLLARTARTDPAAAERMAGTLQGRATEALEDLRDLARGIYPPLLQDKGLVAALEAQARKAAIPTTVEGNGIGRFGQDVEAAVYFSCLEALQNVAKYATASRADVTLSNGEGSLMFTVSDDGVGFDATRTGHGTGLQGIADRLAALGGEVEINSTPGAGTKIVGRLPTGA